MRRLEILRALKKLRQMLENRPDYEEELAEIENRVRKLCFGVSLASGGVKKNL